MCNVTDEQFAAMTAQQRMDVMSMLHEEHMDMCAEFIDEYRVDYPFDDGNFEEYVAQREAECEFYCANRALWSRFLDIQRNFPAVEIWDPARERIKAAWTKRLAEMRANREAA